MSCSSRITMDKKYLRVPWWRLPAVTSGGRGPSWGVGPQITAVVPVIGEQAAQRSAGAVET